MNLVGTSSAWPAQHVPNPCRPVPVGDNAGNGRRWLTQRKRRARILAAARLLMTQQSFEEVHLQAIAAHCGISIQTIYNLVGNRAELMAASAAEWVSSIAATAREDAAKRDRNAPFTLLSMFWSAAMTHTAYVESAVRTSATDSTPLKRPFLLAGFVEFEADLTRLRRENVLRDSIDISSLARQLTISAHSSICHWKMEQYPLAHFRRDLINGPGLMLAAALRGDEMRRLEHGIAEIEALH